MVWTERALALGAEAAILLPVTKVVTAAWVRRKCQYGCSIYGRHLTCPPYTPAPEETHRLLRSYRSALLLRLNAEHGHEEDGLRRKMHELVASLERELFLAGKYRAWGLAAGPCPWCEECNLGGPCRLPRKARPSMEACGIDVYATTRGAGWRLEVVRNEGDAFSLFGLVLVE